MFITNFNNIRIFFFLRLFRILKQNVTTAVGQYAKQHFNVTLIYEDFKRFIYIYIYLHTLFKIHNQTCSICVRPVSHSLKYRNKRQGTPPAYNVICIRIVGRHAVRFLSANCHFAYLHLYVYNLLRQQYSDDDGRVWMMLWTDCNLVIKNVVAERKTIRVTRPSLLSSCVRVRALLLHEIITGRKNTRENKKE